MISWIKRNKLVTILVLIIVFLFFRSSGRSPLDLSESGSMMGIGDRNLSYDSGLSAPSSMSIGQAVGKRSGTDLFSNDAPPQNETGQRLVVSESYLSMLVKNVVETRKQILTFVEQNGGYMVESNISNPQDAPTSSITVRVPSDSLEQTLEHFRSLSVKVVSENLSGQDVTDEYVDVEKRIAILEKTKAKFEEILSQAREVSDITSLNREIINTQNQIDQLKGSQEGMKQRAQLARITIYLSTDEIALPYAPSETFRPEVIFKFAVRSLVSNLRKAAAIAIWLGVYSVIIVPVLLIGWWIMKKRAQKSSITKN